MFAQFCKKSSNRTHRLVKTKEMCIETNFQHDFNLGPIWEVQAVDFFEIS